MNPVFHETQETPKGWGKEVQICNNELYCGKFLHFNAGAKFSAHFHDKKNESFYVLKGRIRFIHIGSGNALRYSRVMEVGDVVDIPRLCVHQVEALEESVVIEVSTTHQDSDSYRVAPGDSQK